MYLMHVAVSTPLCLFEINLMCNIFASLRFRFVEKMLSWLRRKYIYIYIIISTYSVACLFAVVKPLFA